MTDTTTKGTELVQWDPLEQSLIDPTQRVTIPESDADVAAQIIEDILSAETEDDLREAGKIYSFPEVKDQVFEITGITPRGSDVKNGPGWYVVIDAVRERDRRAVRIQSGSRQILAWCLKLHKMDLIPCRVKFIEVGKAKEGQDAPQGLELLPGSF